MMMMMTMIYFYIVGDMPTISEVGTISQWLDVKDWSSDWKLLWIDGEIYGKL
jgi:hypothetical protein